MSENTRNIPTFHEPSRTFEPYFFDGDHLKDWKSDK